jgi:demethylmenaquinone methyltransferase/2-methoxy-6-polyprenyl-1,4-benzoquinol methylase
VFLAELVNRGKRVFKTDQDGGKVKTDKQPERSGVWQMFNRIAGRYDILNHLLSLGQDIRWRKKVATVLPEREDMFILDLATGTGDQLIYLLQNTSKIKKAIGTDLAIEMLEIGKKKIRKTGLTRLISLEEGDARQIRYDDCTFDMTTIAFGIRNVTEVNRALSEMFRVLKNGGRSVILEFSLPENPLIRTVYLIYFRYILPLIGGFVSGDSQAYRYLNQTVESFPFGEDFCDLIRAAGFENVNKIPLLNGIATIYYGDRPNPV